MAKARAIVKRLKTVRNIRKITRTMELIATARFKKAMDRATEAASYTKKISEIVADLSQVDLDFQHPLLKPHESQNNVVLLVLTSNRGFNGGYNGSVMRLAMQRIREAQSDGLNLSVEVSGKRGIKFLRFQRQAVDKTYTQFEDKPAFDEVEPLAERYLEHYVTGRIDRLEIVYVKFLSASRQQAVIETLLPFGDLATGKTAGSAEQESKTQIDYEFLPSAQEILEEIVPASFKARLFKCFLDAAVSDQIFRMVAMKAATENAGDMINDLSRQYNRARQTQITSELSEIIGGAAALE